jgi:hypothetical protein
MKVDRLKMWVGWRRRWVRRVTDETTGARRTFLEDSGRWVLTEDDD